MSKYLVHNGEVIENKPKNKSIRRALAVRNERILMIESKNRESFYDFSNALIDIGISDAIYLVGGNAYGWYYNKDYVRHEFGEIQPDIPENISYIIWR
ncbi:MAG: phosphodiester glycosidase family protein [Tannerella sp.]|nr:phosphodiester glycosidase family protein [Tannerella sp.]